MKHGLLILSCLVLISALVGYSPSAGLDPPPQAEKQDKPDKAKADKPAAPPTDAPKKPTHKVEKGPFKVEVTLKGNFEAQEMTEVFLRPEAWTPDTRGMLIVMRAVEQGAAVKKGDTLVWLDLDKIDQAIRDLEAERALSDLTIKLAEEELPLLEKSTPVDLAAAERAKKLADEDLKKFVQEDRAVSEKSVQHYVKMARHWLEYEKEELRQLEKMYKANDLTEETEEIILKRQRNSVEDAEFDVKMAEYRRDQLLKLDLPRREQNLTENALKMTLALEKAQTTLPLALNQKKQALVKTKYDRQRSADRLRDLKKDREIMTVKSPADGIVYYGKCTRGQWTTAASAAGRLQRGGLLMPDEVFMTIVKPTPMFVRAVVEEKDLPNVRAGLKSKVTPVGNADLKLAGKVDAVTPIPVTPGNFEARIALDERNNSAVVPGMACNVKLAPYMKEDAISVPNATVFSEELDEDKHYVYLAGKDGKHEKRSVTVGKKMATKTEILEGLKEGDDILLERPMGK